MNKKYSVRVYHSYYGCESGCCGHRMDLTEILESGETRWILTDFDFDHPSGEDMETEESRRSYVKNLALDFLTKRFPECLKSIDWDTLSVDELET